MIWKRFYLSFQVFPSEVPVFVREYGGKMYRLDVYYISKIVVEVGFSVPRSTFECLGYRGEGILNCHFYTQNIFLRVNKIIGTCNAI
jgi:hypothetical protein